MTSKQAEKDYLRKSGSLEWELVKPFSPPGSTHQESLRLIHDFAVAAQALDLLPGHRVLDVGVGAGWTTEWLRRLNVNVIGLDIAHDMLLVGKRRIPPPPLLVAGDLEALPFAAGTFDRVVCLNALHHVPDPATVLREVRIVLNEHGRLVLIEPGAGHASRETSRAAVEQFGVLERELEAGELMRLCEGAGFEDVVIRPLSYASGEIQLDLDRLIRWNQWSQRRRPLRVARKLWRLAQELVGAAKESEQFEESLGIWLSRVLARHMSEQAVIVAGKSPLKQLSAPYAADLGIVGVVRGSTAYTIEVRCRNIGTACWRAQGKHRVQIGFQLTDAAGHIVDRDYARAGLPTDLAPQHECVVHCAVPRPDRGAALRVSVVVEELVWVHEKAEGGVVVDLAG